MAVGSGGLWDAGDEGEGEGEDEEDRDVEDPRPVEFKDGKPSYDLHYLPEGGTISGP